MTHRPAISTTSSRSGTLLTASTDNITTGKPCFLAVPTLTARDASGKVWQGVLAVSALPSHRLDQQGKRIMENFSLPQVVVRAGLTGHRPNHLRISAELVAERIGQVLDGMASAATQIAQDAELYLPADPILRVTTGLARGTDEIGADVALAKGWQLQSVIAFDQHKFVDLAVADCKPEEAAAYRQHHADLVSRSSSVLELHGNEKGGFRRDGYELTGEIILEQADVLIGVWDGERAHGLGGSAHLLRLAMQRGLPVVWIHATRPDEKIAVYLPGQPGRQDLHALQKWLINSLRLPLSSTSHAGGSDTAREHWADFVAEDGGRTGRFIPFFQYLLMLGGKAPPRWRLPASDSESNWRDNWQQFRDSIAEFDGGIAEQMEVALQRPFHRADHLAEIYGRAYRGAYILIYLLASAAATAGLLGLLAPFFHHHKPVLVVFELLTIITMIGVTLVGRNNRWHERWLEYRAVAELLRQARMGLWTGQSLEPGDPESHGNRSSASWTSWYVRACVRQVPMIQAKAMPDYLRKAARTIARLEIDDQRGFNERTAKVQEQVHERMEIIEICLLVVLIAACLAFLAVFGFGPLHTSEGGSHHWWAPQIPEWMTLIGGLVPALGAALLGMRSQGDFQAYAERAAATASQLRPIGETAARWDDPGNGDPGFEDLLDLIDRTTEALAGDVFSWRTVYQRKVLTVSA